MGKMILSFGFAVFALGLAGCATGQPYAVGDFLDFPGRTYTVTEVTLVTADRFWSSPEGARAVFDALPINAVESQIENLFGIAVDTSAFTIDRGAGWLGLTGPKARDGRDTWTWSSPDSAGGRYVVVRIEDWPARARRAGVFKVTAFVSASAPDKANDSKVTSEADNHLDLLHGSRDPANAEATSGATDIVATAMVDITLPPNWTPQHP